MASLAESLGRIYFNVFNLECAEPSFPKVCLHTTNAFPKNILEKRLWPGIFGDQPEENQDWAEVCTEWEIDTEAVPKMIFKKPKLLF